MKTIYDLLIAGSSVDVPTATDNIDTRRDITEIVTHLIFFIRIFSLLGGIVLIVMAIRKFIACNKTDKIIKKKQLENLVTPDEIEGEKLKNDDEKGKGILWIVLGIFLLGVAFISKLVELKPSSIIS